MADELRANVPTRLALEHIGSTGVPGMAAKDCLDLMIMVDDLASAGVEQRLGPHGYRRRPEPWNNSESAGGRAWPKQVFAPPVGARPCNLHVRTGRLSNATLSRPASSSPSCGWPSAKPDGRETSAIRLSEGLGVG